MTPLHWAVYNEDIDTIKYLVDNGATQKFNTEGMSPVDVAGYCDTPKLVKYFYNDLRKKIKPLLPEYLKLHKMLDQQVFGDK